MGFGVRGFQGLGFQGFRLVIAQSAPMAAENKGFGVLWFRVCWIP